MQIQDQPHIGVLSADAAATAQFLRRIQALDAETAALLPLSPTAVPDCEPYLCGASTHAPLQKLSEAAEILAASGCTVIAVPDSAGIFCTQLTAAAGIPVLTRYPEGGGLGKVYLGFSGYGVDLYVPKSRESEARALLLHDE